MKEERDEVLVRRVAESGDERAFSELYDRYVGLVYGAGMRYLRDRAHAEDLVQEVFLSVWRGAASFDVSKADFGTWIYRITRNRATDQVRWRRSRVRTVGSDLPLEPEEADPASDLSRSFDVAAALSHLAPIHWEVLTLAYIEGLTQREISHRIDTPLGTVKSRTTAALLAMRQNMLNVDVTMDGLPEDERASSGPGSARAIRNGFAGAGRGERGMGSSSPLRNLPGGGTRLARVPRTSARVRELH